MSYLSLKDINLSLKDINLSIEKLIEYRKNLKYQLDDLNNKINMSEQLKIVDKIRIIDKKIKDLKKNIPESKKGFQIDYVNKSKYQLEKIDDRLNVLSNKTRQNLTTEERDELYKEIDKLINTRTVVQTQQQKHISGLGKNKRKRKRITKKRKRKQKKGMEESKKGGKKKRKTKKKKDKFILIKKNLS